MTAIAGELAILALIYGAGEAWPSYLERRLGARVHPELEARWLIFIGYLAGWAIAAAAIALIVAVVVL